MVNPKFNYSNKKLTHYKLFIMKYFYLLHVSYYNKIIGRKYNQIDLINVLSVRQNRNIFLP